MFTTLRIWTGDAIDGARPVYPIVEPPPPNEQLGGAIGGIGGGVGGDGGGGGGHDTAKCCVVEQQRWSVAGFTTVSIFGSVFSRFQNSPSEVRVHNVLFEPSQTPVMIADPIEEPPVPRRQSPFPRL